MARPKEFDKDEVLTRAMLQFWRSGYSQTSMQDLVACMGIQKGSLYGTFGGKRDLFLQAFDQYETELDQVFERILAGEGTPREKIAQGMLCSMQLHSSHGVEGFGCLITNSAVELSSTDPEIRKRILNYLESSMTFFQGLIDQAKTVDGVTSKAPSKAIAEVLIMLLEGMQVLNRVFPEPDHAKQRVDSIMNCLLPQA